MYLLLLGVLPTVLALFECGLEQTRLDIQNGYEIDAEFVAPEQDCVLNFTWPVDYIAHVTVNAGLLTRGDFIVMESKWDDVSSNQRISSNRESLNVDVVWPKSRLQMHLHSGSDTVMVLSISIKLEEFSPTSLTKYVKWEYQIAPGDCPTLVSTEMWAPQSAIRIKAATKIAVAKKTPKNSNIDWKNFFMYERSGTDMKFFGTLAGFEKSFIHDGNDLIIYNSRKTPIHNYLKIEEATLIVKYNEHVPTLFNIWWNPLCLAKNLLSKFFQ